MSPYLNHAVMTEVFTKLQLVDVFIKLLYNLITLIFLINVRLQITVESGKNI